MVLGLGGENTMLPDEWLADIPLVDSWMVPGLVLGAGSESEPWWSGTA